MKSKINKFFLCLSIVLIIKCLASLTTQAQVFLSAGYSSSYIHNYNDDKGSVYYPASNFMGNRFIDFYNLGLGYRKWQNTASHVVEIGYRKIGGKAKYDELIRPTYSVPITAFYPADEHHQGINASLVTLSYSYMRHIGKKFDAGLSATYNWKIHSRLTNEIFYQGKYIGGDSHDAAESYINKSMYSLGTKIDYNLSKYLSFNFTYDFYISALNNRIDEIMIRKYHPHYLSIGIKIFKD